MEYHRQQLENKESKEDYSLDVETFRLWSFFAQYEKKVPKGKIPLFLLIFYEKIKKIKKTLDFSLWLEYYNCS